MIHPERRGDAAALITIDRPERHNAVDVRFTRLFSPKPTIAAISGHRLAGGMELDCRRGRFRAPTAGTGRL
ncbi:hypothetical protein DVA67_033000 [Solirubrobacter sp. CPCC 204708]|uniref:Enoyl-CoA hydratase/isomerase family protein n=1 Tax=Solirubrobacter deserti TaxID=2282478 RepID=A0ABT4RIU7_9ACTN|nr:hypothetical protein [Solirubrobacter deserti]MBE2320824.1 hypothetical protein [Solirubrobacter deserti]MDA0138459.1 hypothetical protein [Solirubrobacter deserti]